MKNLILITLFSFCLAFGCSKSDPVNSDGNGNNNGDNGDNGNGGGGGGITTVTPKVIMEFTSVPSNVSSSGVTKITGLITPYFNAHLGEFAATIAEATVSRDMPDDSTGKPSTPAILTVCYAANKFKTHIISPISKNEFIIKPYKIVENSEKKIEALYGVSTDIISGKEYRSETTFVADKGITLTIKFYVAILSKQNKVLAKSQELNKTYIIQ
ncbi:MAG: hypothetical protein ACQPRJ_02310 [Solitalea-like symbiont of Acarus siro]